MSLIDNMFTKSIYGFIIEIESFYNLYDISKEKIDNNVLLEYFNILDILIEKMPCLDKNRAAIYHQEKSALKNIRNSLYDKLKGIYDLSKIKAII